MTLRITTGRKKTCRIRGLQAIAEVIKKRLEDNGVKVKEMYAIEHKGEKADSKSKEYHNSTDATKRTINCCKT